jgi:PAS domain S-box-containing protein
VNWSLEQNTARFQRLAEHGRDVFYRFCLTPPHTEYISSAALAIMGHRPEEFYADPDLALKAVHPEDRHLVAEVRDLNRATMRATVVIRWIHPDGRVVWAEHCRVPIIDAAGRLVAIEGVGRDVTERVETQRLLADRELRFRLLTENALDMIYRYRMFPTRGSDYVSPAALAITGYSPEQMMLEPNLGIRILHPDDREKGIAMVTDRAAMRVPTILRYVRPDGRIVSVEHRNRPIFDEEGRLVAIEGIGRDVTESLAIQDRLRASERQLRRLAARLQSARESERTLMARELHDELGQTLTALKMEVARCVRDLMPLSREPGMIDRLQSMVGAIELATETVRRMATALRPPALDHLGLGAAIELEAAALSRRTGLRSRVTGSVHVAALTPEQTIAVFRIVQEGLTNVLRHAKASAVKIVMTQRKRSVMVKIQDNGIGIHNEAVDDPGALGLLGMRERAGLIGAKLSITGKSGRGTAVLITVPVRSSKNDEDR